MKKLVSICLIGLFTITAVAQKGSRQDHKEGRKMMEKMAEMTPEQRADLKTKEMALALDLSTGQQAQVMALQLDLEQKRQEKIENRKEQKDRKELTSEQLYEMRSARLDEAIRVKKEMKSILTDEQFAEFETNIEKKKKRRGMHMKQRRGKK